VYLLIILFNNILIIIKLLFFSMSSILNRNNTIDSNISSISLEVFMGIFFKEIKRFTDGFHVILGTSLNAVSWPLQFTSSEWKATWYSKHGNFNVKDQYFYSVVVFQQEHSVTQWIISSLFSIGKQERWNDSLCYIVLAKNRPVTLKCRYRYVLLCSFFII